MFCVPLLFMVPFLLVSIAVPSYFRPPALQHWMVSVGMEGAGKRAGLDGSREEELFRQFRPHCVLLASRACPETLSTLHSLVLQVLQCCRRQICIL